jgi:hypothetical protein
MTQKDMPYRREVEFQGPTPTELGFQVEYTHTGVVADFYDELLLDIKYPTAEAAENPSMSELTTSITSGMLHGMGKIQSLGNRRLDPAEDDPFRVAALMVPGFLMQSSLIKPDQRYDAVVRYLHLTRGVPGELDTVRRNLAPQPVGNGKRFVRGAGLVEPEKPDATTGGMPLDTNQTVGLALSFLTFAGITAKLAAGQNAKASMVRTMGRELNVEPYDPGKRAVGILKDLAITSELRKGLKRVGVSIEDAYSSALAINAHVQGFAKAKLLADETYALQNAYYRGPNIFRGTNMQAYLEGLRQPLREILDGYVKTGAFDEIQLDQMLSSSLEQVRFMTKAVPDSAAGAAQLESFEANHELINKTTELRDELIRITGVDMKTDIHHLIRIMPRSSAPKPSVEPIIETPAEAEEEPAIPEVDNTAEQKETLLARHEALLVDLTDLREPYQASNRALRKEGLNHLLHDLLLGYIDPLTEKEMEGITGDQSQQIIALLYGLGQELKDADPADAQYAVAYTVASEINIVRDILAIRRELYALGINGFGVVHKQLSANLDWLYANRETLAASIHANLPKPTAKHYTDLLDKLFASLELAPVDLVAEATAESEAELEPEPESIDPSPTEGPVAEIVDTPELPETIAKVLAGLALPLNEREVALQLDWEVFPADVTLATIRTQTERGLSDSDAAAIDWSRIKDLLEISRSFKGTVYRSKPRSLGATIPYFVAEIDIDGYTFAIGENPQYGNASYILRADLAAYGASWQEIFEQPRQLARLLGAEQVVHTPKRAHLDRIMDVIQSQILVKAR